MDSLPKSKLNHDVRLLEAETAIKIGIPFNEEWYDIPIIAREHMVATILARNWINSISSYDSG